MSATTVSEAKQWCDHAREILKKKRGSPFKSDRTKFEEANTSLNKLLTEYKGKLNNAVQTHFETQYQTMAGEVHVIDQNTARLKEKEQQTELTKVVGRMVILNTKLQTIVSEYNSYTQAAATANKELRETKTLNRENKTYDGPLAALILSAKTKADNATHANEGYKKATEELTNKKTGASALATEAENESKEDNKNTLNAAQHKPVFDNKVERIKAAIKQLEALAGTKTFVDTLKGLITAGNEEVTNSQDYEKAYKKLSGLSDNLEKGLAAAEKFKEKAGDRDGKFQEALVATEAKIEEYERAAGLSDPDAVIAARNLVTVILKAIELNPTDGPTITKAIKDIKKVGTDVQSKLDTMTLDKNECERLLPITDKLTASVRFMGDTATYLPILAKWRAASALLSAQDYKNARADLEALETEATTAKNKLQGPYDGWNATSKEVDKDFLPILKKATAIDFPMGAKLPDWRRDASLLLTKYASISETVVTTHDFDGAWTIAKQVKADVISKKIKEHVEKFDALADKRNEGWEFFKGKEKAFTPELNKLKEAGGNTVPFEDAMLDVRNQYLDATRAEFEAGKLDIAIQALKDRLRVIATDIESTLNNDGGKLDASKLATSNKKILAELANLEKDTTAHINYLKQEFPLDAKPFEEQYAQLQLQKSTITPGSQKTLLEVLLDSVQKKIQEKTAAKELTAQQVEAAGKICLGLVKDVSKKLSKFTKFVEALKAEVNDCIQMSTSSVTSVVESAKASLTGPSGEIFKKLTDLKNGTDHTTVKTKLDELKDALDADNIKKCFPVKRETLKTQLEQGITPNCYEVSPALALSKVLPPFEADVDQLKQDATAATTKREKIAELIAEIKTSLKGKLSDAPKLKAEFEARLKNSASPREDSEDMVINQLNTMKKLVALVTAETESGVNTRNDMERSATEKAFNAEVEQKKWLSESALFEKNELRAAKAAYDEVDRGKRDSVLMKDIETTFKDAKDMAEKGMYDLANEKLRDAKQKANDLKANPFNARATARNQLAKVNLKWKKTVSEFIRTITKMANDIATEAKDNGVDATSADAVKKGVSGIAMYFDAGIFDKTITAMTADEIHLTQLRSYKEDGLRFVRLAQNRLKTDPVLLHVRNNNPFETSADALFERLEDALNDLELNLKRA